MSESNDDEDEEWEDIDEEDEEANEDDHSHVSSLDTDLYLGSSTSSEQNETDDEKEEHPPLPSGTTQKGEREDEDIMETKEKVAAKTAIGFPNIITQQKSHRTEKEMLVLASSAWITSISERSLLYPTSRRPRKRPGLTAGDALLTALIQFGFNNMDAAGGDEGEKLKGGEENEINKTTKKNCGGRSIPASEENCDDDHKEEEEETGVCVLDVVFCYTLSYCLCITDEPQFDAFLKQKPRNTKLLPWVYMISSTPTTNQPNDHLSAGLVELQISGGSEQEEQNKKKGREAEENATTNKNDQMKIMMDASIGLRMHRWCYCFHHSTTTCTTNTCFYPAPQFAAREYCHLLHFECGNHHDPLLVEKQERPGVWRCAAFVGDFSFLRACYQSLEQLRREAVEIAQQKEKEEKNRPQKKKQQRNPKKEKSLEEVIRQHDKKDNFESLEAEVEEQSYVMYLKDFYIYAFQGAVWGLQWSLLRWLMGLPHFTIPAEPFRHLTQVPYFQKTKAFSHILSYLTEKKGLSPSEADTYRASDTGHFEICALYYDSLLLPLPAPKPEATYRNILYTEAEQKKISALRYFMMGVVNAQQEELLHFEGRKHVRLSEICNKLVEFYPKESASWYDLGFVMQEDEVTTVYDKEYSQLEVYTESVRRCWEKEDVDIDDEDDDEDAVSDAAGCFVHLGSCLPRGEVVKLFGREMNTVDCYVYAAEHGDKDTAAQAFANLGACLAMDEEVEFSKFFNKKTTKKLNKMGCIQQALHFSQEDPQSLLQLAVVLSVNGTAEDVAELGWLKNLHANEKTTATTAEKNPKQGEEMSSSTVSTKNQEWKMHQNCCTSSSDPVDDAVQLLFRLSIRFSCGTYLCAWTSLGFWLRDKQRKQQQKTNASSECLQEKSTNSGTNAADKNDDEKKKKRRKKKHDEEDEFFGNNPQKCFVEVLKRNNTYAFAWLGLFFTLMDDFNNASQQRRKEEEQKREKMKEENQNSTNNFSNAADDDNDMESMLSIYVPGEGHRDIAECLENFLKYYVINGQTYWVVELSDSKDEDDDDDRGAGLHYCDSPIEIAHFGPLLRQVGILMQVLFVEGKDSLNAKTTELIVKAEEEREEEIQCHSKVADLLIKYFKANYSESFPLISVKSASVSKQKDITWSPKFCRSEAKRYCI